MCEITKAPTRKQTGYQFVRNDCPGRGWASLSILPWQGRTELQRLRVNPEASYSEPGHVNRKFRRGQTFKRLRA